MAYDKKRTALLNRYPAIEDLAKKARARIPHVAWEYLQTGTGQETLVNRNRKAFDEIILTPQFCKGPLQPKIETNLFGKTYAAPFGIAPVGLTGLMWPRAEIHLAKAAARNNIPFTLSTVATETPETLSPYIGEQGWFQLYPPRDVDLRKKLLVRAKQSGFHTLVVTADVPMPSRRERTKRAGLSTPPKITPRFIWQGIIHPTWSWYTLKNGLPRLRTVETYSEFDTMKSVGEFVRHGFRGDMSWDYCKALREEWDGPIVIKGLLHPSDVLKAIEIGMDGVVISNHGARQFDAAPTSVEAMKQIVPVAKGKIKLIMDSGIRSGLDVLRAMHLGADFVLLGRAFMYGVCALDKYGPDHVFEILTDELRNSMVQMGIEELPM